MKIEIVYGRLQTLKASVERMQDEAFGKSRAEKFMLNSIKDLIDDIEAGFPDDELPDDFSTHNISDANDSTENDDDEWLDDDD